jgi:hypothetical protein
MAHHHKKDVKSGDLMLAGLEQSTANDIEEVANTPDAMQNNTTITGTTLVFNPAAIDDGRGTYHSGHTALSVDADKQTTTPRASKDSNTLTQPLNDNIQHATTPFDLPDSAPNDTTAPSLETLLKDAHSLGAMLEHTYRTTTSSEMRQIIACLVSLDVAITRQTQLNEVHEQHTGKNFRELRHINKDRKMLVQETVKSVTTKLSRMEGQCMTQQTATKQGEVRSNSHGIQIKGLLERAHMLAEGGEWAEAEIAEIKQSLEGLQEEVDLLKLDNQGLRGQVEGMEKKVHAQQEKEKAQEKESECLRERVASLEKEVNASKKKEIDWEQRVTAMEKLFRGKE